VVVQQPPPVVVQQPAPVVVQQQAPTGYWQERVVGYETNMVLVTVPATTNSWWTGTNYSEFISPSRTRQVERQTPIIQKVWVGQ